MIIVSFFINLVTFSSKGYTREINKEYPSGKYKTVIWDKQKKMKEIQRKFVKSPRTE